MRLLRLAPLLLALLACGGEKPAATAKAPSPSSTAGSPEKPPTAEELKKAFMDECTKESEVSLATCTCSYDAIVAMKGTVAVTLEADEKTAIRKKVHGCMAADLEATFMKACTKTGSEMAPFCKCTYPSVAARVEDGGDVDETLRASLYVSCGALYPETHAKTDFVKTCTDAGSKEATCSCAFASLKAKTKHSNGALSTYAAAAKKDIDASVAACAKKPSGK